MHSTWLALDAYVPTSTSVILPYPLVNTHSKIYTMKPSSLSEESISSIATYVNVAT
jgi:hypothetical protein